MIRIGIALVTAALLVVHPRPVFAGGCHGGGGGGGGGHSGGGGGGGHSGGGRSEPACVDTTDLVGYRHCTHYGAWASSLILPHIIIEMGTNVRQFGSQLHDQQGSVTHGDEPFTYRIVMPTSASHRDVAVTTNLRIGFGFAHGLYALLEGEVGGLVAPAQASVEMTQTGTFGAPSVTRGASMLLGGYGVVGIRNSTHAGTLAFELAGGDRSVFYNFKSAYHECKQTTTVSSSQLVAEARARGELWLGPWVTLGATLGTSVVARGDWLAGVYLGMHTRSFGGQR